MDPDEIWHRYGPQGVFLRGGGRPSTPHPLGTGCINGVSGASGASVMHFGQNFKKQKLLVAPYLVGVGHLP